MSKMCDTVFTDAELDEARSAFGIPGTKGIIRCNKCRQPSELHGSTITERALWWALSGDTGISSETMCRTLAGTGNGRYSHPPSDADDRGRCIRLLELIPEWLDRLNELTALDTGKISINGAPYVPVSETDGSWTHQIPLIIKEGGF